MNIQFQKIGTICSPFTDRKGMPIQPSGAGDIKGSIEVFPEFQEGLKDLDGFSHIILIYHFHMSDSYTLTVTPFLDNNEHGVFATRAPRRPNSIGLSIVKLEKIEGCTLFISNVDILDKTPLLDIKPYVPRFDEQNNVRTGWLEQSGSQVETRKSDDRFIT